MGQSKVILPKKLVGDPQRMARVITNTLNATAKNIKIDFQVTSQTWNDKPDFVIEQPDPYERIIGTSHKIYDMLNEGTRAHDIRPRNGKVLRFGTPFRAKTIPRSISSGPGSKSKNVVWSRGVHHPGTKPRKWDEAIREKWDGLVGPIFQRAIDSSED
jgi:hypothetical protein